MKHRVVVICGPTGIGKTDVSIDIAEKFRGEVVGADSMQVYKHMDIGTAKPDAREQKIVPHHVIDFLMPDMEFDAGKYKKAADTAIRDICERGRLPIVAGGTGLYIRALLHGLFSARTPDRTVVARLEKIIEDRGAKHLHKMLKNQDPETALKIHPNDSFRVIRALEVIESTGDQKSLLIKRHKFRDSRYSYVKIGLYMERKSLYRRIDKRVDKMVKQGLVDEVKSLLDMGYSSHLKSMNAIGYRHVCAYLSGAVDFDEMVRLLKRDTRRFAKRQFTWFKKERDIVWFRPDEKASLYELVDHFLNNMF